MERTCQYQLLTARASLVAGNLAIAGAILSFISEPGNPLYFGIIWSSVFAGSMAATCLSSALRGRQRGEPFWSRQARAVLLALAPSIFVAFCLSALFFARGDHLWLPGIWMLCYGQGALATSAYAPKPIFWLGISVLLLGSITLLIGPDYANLMMGLVFGMGHLVLGGVLLTIERRQASLRIHRSVA
jgi:hypothetical protein